MAWGKTGNIRGPAGAAGSTTSGASGALTPKRWIGKATTNSSGDATFDISSAGFTAAPLTIQAVALASDNTPANALNAYPSGTPSATSVTISVVKPVTLIVLALTAAKVGAGVTVYLTAEGS